MELTPGTVVGPYKILGQLGVGGMGEVYRAQDTRLGREVAVKVLPASVASDPDRRSRFDREARMLASLSHPNIATLHGVEAYEGRTLIDQELVPGETLAESISQSPLKTDSALRVFRQIASALEAAHGAGIIHRDLKPANVKITPDGRVKVLDFGLAKAVTEEGSGEFGSDAVHTFTQTQVGTVVGTISYMSPEQLRGQKLDRRTDIWAFGCMIYESLSGRTPFAAETASDTVSQILREEPDWTVLPPMPAALRRLMQRCLTKDVQLRLRDISDARLEIEDVLHESAASRPAASAASGTISIPVLPPRFRMPAAIAAVAIASASLGWWSGGTSDSAAPAVRLEVSLPPSTRLAHSAAPPLALSPDGTRIAFVAQRPGGRTQIHLRPIDSFEAVALAGTEGGSGPFFSPDGQWVGFFANGALQKVSIGGGAVLRIAEAPSLWSAAWNDDGVIVFATTGTPNQLRWVSADGGVAQQLTAPAEDQGEQQHAYPQLLPGGKGILFSVITEKGWFLESATLPGGTRRRLRQSPIDGPTAYLASGHLAYSQGGGLVAVPFDASDGTLTGAPIPMNERVEASALGGALFAVSSSGTLVYVPQPAALPRRTIVVVERDGRTRTLVPDRAAFSHPRLSPDGSMLAVALETESGQDIWVFDMSRGTRTRLTAGGENGYPVWGPDSTTIAFQASHASGPSLYTRTIGGSAASALVNRSNAAALAQAMAGLLPGSVPQLAAANPHVPASWVRSGSIAFDEQKPSAERDIWVMPKDGSPSPFLLTPFDESSPELSPDAKWLAYVSDEAGPSEVYVQPYPGPGGKWVISDGGGSHPVWSPSGNELLYQQGDRLMAVDVRYTPDFQASRPRAVLEWPQDGTAVRNFDISRDGRFFVMIRNDEGRAPDQLRVVLRWTQDLAARRSAAR